jgi:hypothetical protein
MAPPRESLKFRLLRHILAIYAAVAAGWLGLRGGSALINAIAALTDRDIAELTDMVVWSSLSAGAVGALAGVWLVLLLTRASREAQTITLFALAIAFACGATLLLVSYDWPKSLGRPVVQFELQLPAGMPLPDRSDIDITIWRERSGHGCYVADVRMQVDRPEIAGNCVIASDNPEPKLSLRLNRSMEGHWRLPFGPEAKLEPAFGPWQRVEFVDVPSPRGTIKPLPPGAYEIRYRVRRYM